MEKTACKPHSPVSKSKALDTQLSMLAVSYNRQSTVSVDTTSRVWLLCLRRQSGLPTNHRGGGAIPSNMSKYPWHRLSSSIHSISKRLFFRKTKRQPPHSCTDATQRCRPTHRERYSASSPKHPIHTPGAIQCSVSCPRTLTHIRPFR